MKTVKPLALSALLGFTASAVQAESTLPLLTIDKVVYSGAFRIPAGTFGDSSANYSYGAIGFNPDRNSMFVAGHEYNSAIAEFTIPSLVNSTNLADLKIANAPIQNFADVLHKATVDWGNGLRISGIFYSNKKLMVNMYRFYDQSPFLQTPTLILDDATNIKGSTTKGYITAQNGVRATGWISPIPKDLQTTLGGTHMGGFTSSTNRAIIYNASVGPAAYAYNPVDAINNSSLIKTISTTELLNYTLDNGLVPMDDLYNTSLTNKLWTHMSEASFAMIVPGTRSYLVLGGSGGHVSGMAYGIPPYGGYKGHYTIDPNDRYPYYWLYDVNDFEKVRKGTLKSYQVKPYAYGVFNAPFQTDIVNRISGGTYDEATGTMYLSIFQADNSQGGGTNPPVIAAYKFGVAAAPASTTPSAPAAPVNLKIQTVN
jgi:hypothetical protein